MTAAVVAALIMVGACSRSGDDGQPSSPRSTTTVGSTIPPAPPPAPDDQAVEVAVPDRPRGGSARVGVWAEPDPAAPTTGGAAVRALVLPQLFVARPDGRWSPALVEPRSDVTAADARSATFRLRSGAVWSDGSPITVADLDRTADRRFVSVVSAADDGTITVEFTSPLPGWRRLWSAQDSIAAPAPGVWGGPFVVASVVPGLETVLARNPTWSGSGGPFLDEVRLVLVPDATTARQLLGRGEVDVVMPLAGTVRTEQLSSLPSVSVDRVERGGWSVVLLANGSDGAGLTLERRQALLASFDREAFVRTLLAGEASLLQGFSGSGEDATWASVGTGDVGALRGETVDLVGFVEEPMTGLVHRSMQKRVRAGTEGRATIELRLAEADRVEGWLVAGSYEAAVVPWLDPLGGCWTCRWPSLGEAARAADAGSPEAVAAAQLTLRESAIVLPLWHPTTVVAWRSGLSGVRANGYAASGAWNAWEWWRTAAADG